MTFKIILFLLALVGISNGASTLIVDDKIYSKENGFILVSDWFGREIPKNLINIYTQGLSNSPFAEILIAAPFGEELRTGLYTGVTRYKFPVEIINDQVTVPSMEILTLTNENDFISAAWPCEGLFNVLEIEWRSDGRLMKAAVDWQITTGALVPSYGKLRYNSDMPLNAVPEPSIPFLCLLSLGIVARRKR